MARCSEELLSLIDDVSTTILDVIGSLRDFEMIREFQGQTSTIVITDECNLRCTYCYCTKTPLAMKWDTAKKYIDLLFEENLALAEIPIKDQVALKHRKIFEFIGGEPLLEAKLMFQCMDYILKRVRALPDNHPWKRTDWPCGCTKENHPTVGIRFMISTNGVSLKEEWIRNEFLKYSEKGDGDGYVHIGITLDGTKEMHDLCRVTTAGKGSYEDVMLAWRWLSNHFPMAVISTKSTISHENIDYIYDIVKFFYELNLRELPQNCVFENVWHRGDQFRLFRQLVKTADYLIEKDRYKRMHVRWFSPQMLVKSTSARKWCGAGVHMDACDGTGNIYPCLRFKQVKTRDPVVMGSVEQGCIRTPEWKKAFSDIDTNPIYSANLEEVCGLSDCDSCPVSSLCSDCQAYAYDCFGVLDAKTPYICPMHKAASVANIYFFSKLFGSPIDTDYLESLLGEWTANDLFYKD